LKKIPRHIFVAASGWGSRVIAAVVQILMIRLVVKTLGADNYAAFALLCALGGWFLLADFGLGFSLQNFISKSRAHGVEYGKLLKSAVKITFILFVFEITCLALLSPWTGSQLLRQFSFIGRFDKYVLFFSACSLQLIVGISQVAYKVWYGEQKGYLSNILPAFSQLLGFGAVTVTLHFRGRLEGLILSYLIPQALIGMFSLGYLWMEHSAEEGSGRQEMKPLLRNALAFGGFNLLVNFVLQADMPIVSHYLPPRQTATYAVISRVFSFIFIIYTSALLALWPVCGEHLAVHDWEPVKRYVRNYILGGWAIVVIFTLLVAYKLSLITSIIAPNAKLEAPVGAILAFGMYYVIRVWTDTYAMVLACRSHLYPLWISTPIQAILSVVFQIILIQRLGVQGAVWGMMGSFLFTAAWIVPWSVRRMRIADEKSPEAMNDEIGAIISDI